MNRNDLARLQREHAIRDLYALLMQCRRRFLRSANLVGMRSVAIERLREFGVSKDVNLNPLIPAWQRICERYLSEIYDPQMSLFQDHKAEVETKWVQFVYWQLFPELVRSDEFVRNVLRALGGLPCRSPEEAAAAVGQHLSEMPLPSAPPPWAPEEAID